MLEIDKLKADGFQGFVKMHTLMADSSMLPEQPGVYVVLYAKGEHPQFLAEGTGGFFKQRNPNVSLDELEANWVDNAQIVYIGKAGTHAKPSSVTIRSRLRQYIHFGLGQGVGHWGGRYIWQIGESRDLLVCWKPTEEEPRDVEHTMINQFRADHHDCRPFANLQD